MTQGNNMFEDRPGGTTAIGSRFATGPLVLSATLLLLIVFPISAEHTSAILSSEFISNTPPTPQDHASTIVETQEGLVAAWFGGKGEGDPGVGIWLSRHVGAHWTPPLEVANGIQSVGARQPCWNPVLFEPRGGPLMLFYKAGPNPAHWWGMLKTSADNGKHWTPARRLPDRVIGPVKDKPLQLTDGTLISPSSNELSHWRIHFELSTDNGQTWVLSQPIANPGGIEAIQPSLLNWQEGNIQAIGRTNQNEIFSTRSKDGGLNWSALALLKVPNPNSGIDAVMLMDKRGLLVYNPTQQGPHGRSTLAIAISDDGERWRDVLTLEADSSGEYSYPAVIQTRDGLVHVTYTWKRSKIKHVVIDPRRL